MSDIFPGAACSKVRFCHHDFLPNYQIYQKLPSPFTKNLLLNAHCKLNTAPNTLYTVNWTLDTADYTLYTTKCTLNTVYCTLPTAHYMLNTAY